MMSLPLNQTNPQLNDLVGGTIRVSIGIFNTKEELDVLINAIEGM